MDDNGYESVDKRTMHEKKYGIKIIGICPEQTNPKPNNMAAKDKLMQKRVLNYFKNAIDVACLVHANQVVVTSGWAYYSESVCEAFTRSVSMLKKVSEYADNKGMLLAIEALQPEESLIANSAEQLKTLIDEVNSPALKVCVDFGAMERAGDTIQSYFDIFKNDIIHTHFVDTDFENGKKITHLAWGDGKRNMKDDILCLYKNGYRGVLSVESINDRYFRRPEDTDKQTIQVYRNSIPDFI